MGQALPLNTPGERDRRRRVPRQVKTLAVWATVAVIRYSWKNSTCRV